MCHEAACDYTWHWGTTRRAEGRDFHQGWNGPKRRKGITCPYIPQWCSGGVAGPSSLVLQPAVSLKVFSARDNYRSVVGRVLQQYPEAGDRSGGPELCRNTGPLTGQGGEGCCSQETVVVSVRVSQITGYFCNRPRTEGKLLVAVQGPICLGKLIICSSLLRFLSQREERREGDN